MIIDIYPYICACTTCLVVCLTVAPQRGVHDQTEHEVRLSRIFVVSVGTRDSCDWASMKIWVRRKFCQGGNEASYLTAKYGGSFEFSKTNEPTISLQMDFSKLVTKHKKDASVVIARGKIKTFFPLILKINLLNYRKQSSAQA